jgi:hypothetical protein
MKTTVISDRWLRDESINNGVWLWRAQRDGLIPARRRGPGQRQEKPQKDI